MALVYVKFPKTGLGNLLLIWARAKVFAHLNQLPMVTSPWWGLRLGAWIRKEKKKRVYWGYFKEDNWLTRTKAGLYKNRATVVYEPKVEIISPEQRGRRNFFLFNKVITENDLFSSIRNYRDYIRTEIYNMLSPAIMLQLNKYETPVISVHIRRGDFKLGNPITPLTFFIDGITAIRKSVNSEWPVTIFTDAESHEIKEVLSLPGVNLTEDKPDILDILLMSKSKALILSQSSTFSYWGAFLSDAVVLKPGNDWQGNLRNEEINQYFPEIRWKENDPQCTDLLKEYFKKIIPQ